MRSRQAGVALIMVLVVLALAGGLSLYLAELTAWNTQSIRHSEHYNSLYYATLSGEALGMAALAQPPEVSSDDFSTLDGPQTDIEKHLGDDASPVSKEVHIEDLQARFNLAELARHSNRGRNDHILRLYQRYCAELGISSDVSSALYDSAMTVADNKSAANIDVTLFYSIIRDLAGRHDLRANVAALLVRHFTTLPVGTPVNMMSAPSALIQALAKDIQPSLVQDFINRRGNHGETQPAHLATGAVQSAMSHSGLNVASRSHYFEITTRVSFEQQHRVLKSVVYRDGKGANVRLIVRYVPELSPENAGTGFGQEYY